MFDRNDYYSITLISNEFGKYLNSIANESFLKNFNLNLSFPTVILDENELSISGRLSKCEKAPKSLNEAITRLSKIFLVDESEFLQYIDDIKELYWEEGYNRAEELYVRENYAPDVLEEMYDYIMFTYEDDEDLETLENTDEITDEIFNELIEFNVDEFTIYTKLVYCNGNCEYINHDPFNNFYF